MKTVSLNSTLERRLPVQRRRRAAPVLRLRAAAVQALATLREWRRRARSRAELAALDDRMLRDIGITRLDVLREIDKPFWRS